MSSAIEGKWVKPASAFMGYSLSLESSGTYRLWSWSDVVSGIPENPKTGRYTFSSGKLTVPVTKRYSDGTSQMFPDEFKRETINGVEVLLRPNAEKIWRRCGMIDTGGLLIKVSDDPAYSESEDEPDTTRLFSEGVEPWSREAETAKLAKAATTAGKTPAKP